MLFSQAGVTKSVVLAVPSSETMMLEGRRSRWMILFLWAWSTPWPICLMKAMAASQSRTFSFSRSFSKVLPLTYSMTIKKTLFAFSAAIMRTMLGWLSAAWRRGSLSSLKSSADCLWGTLIATLISNQVSRARKTDPKPPLPRERMISYFPTFCPCRNMLNRPRRRRLRPGWPQQPSPPSGSGLPKRGSKASRTLMDHILVSIDQAPVGVVQVLAAELGQAAQEGLLLLAQVLRRLHLHFDEQIALPVAAQVFHPAALHPEERPRLGAWGNLQHFGLLVKSTHLG